MWWPEATGATKLLEAYEAPLLMAAGDLSRVRAAPMWQLDGARQAPLSEADCDKLKGALHALAAMLVRSRNTEKTSAVLDEPENPEAGDGAQAGYQRFATTRTRAQRSGGV